ncbi:MAG TPA: YetF domain-containing protein [Gammaproteobacteria bacterium]
MLSPDWHSMFIPTISLVEIVLRGTIIFFFLFFILRIMRREAGALNIIDLLLIVLIADAAQNAMGKEYESLTEGVLLVATIAGWDYALDWVAYRFPRFRRILRPAPLPLIKDGKMLRHNMRREMITEEELLSQLRQHEVKNASEVQECRLEGDGHITVIKKKK